MTEADMDETRKRSQAESFECKMCGECCEGYGGTCITRDDAEKIAEFIGMDVETFIETRCTAYGKKWLLKQGTNGFCIFCKEKRCSIHPVKPKMCREWPFIESVVIDPQSWLTMANSCPGINTEAPIDEVAGHIRSLRSKPPE